jgi:hypothetical protein
MIAQSDVGLMKLILSRHGLLALARMNQINVSAISRWHRSMRALSARNIREELHPIFNL